MSDETTPPKIEFPCENYLVKIIGDGQADFEDVVLTIVEAHAPGFDRTLTRIRYSAGGRFASVTVRITATGIEQLERLNHSLRQTGRVQMVI